MEDKRVEIIDMIIKDVEKVAKQFDGRPFNGKTVGEYFGYHGAAISALADIVKSILIHKGEQK